MLCRHPNILEDVAVGVPDKFWGQEVKALVVVKPGRSLSKEELAVFCKQDLEDYKCPKLVEFVESLPKDTTGKVRRQLP